MKSPESSDNNLWKLLDHASNQEPSSMFSKNVLRQARLSQEETKTSRPWLILAPCLATLALGAGIFFLLGPLHSGNSVAAWDDELSFYLANEKTDQFSNEELALTFLY